MHEKNKKGSYFPSASAPLPMMPALVLKDLGGALHILCGVVVVTVHVGLGHVRFVPLASHAHGLRCSVYLWQINATTCWARCSTINNPTSGLSEGSITYPTRSSGYAMHPNSSTQL